MRTVIHFNAKWAFTKNADQVPDSMPTRWDWVNLPHSWNSIDGQDGGNDYYRGVCYYAKSLKKADLPQAGRYYLEICGANSSANVYLNGKAIAHHDGGYSTWRADLTEELQEENLLVIAVDNSPNDRIYPQTADFTFYGGLYRDVNIICVEDSHFDLDYYGGPGLAVTPELKGSDAKIKISAYVTGRRPGQSLQYTICDRSEAIVASLTTDSEEAELVIRGVHRWHGRKDPYLYTACVELMEGGTILDKVSARFGCRSFEVTADRGFLLNGEEYPLRGVARHQDRWGVGNALLREHHREDMDLICELGATTIRLAHYQHDQYFYDLCDQRGLVVWAEIPYISKHMENGRENTVSQMKELITQNYNHPSIVVWGLSNEITMGGETSDLLENHRLLNDLAHEMDKTRPTTMACISMCRTDSEIIGIPDTLSYNHYFGWYGGDTSMNGPWFDQFHTEHPDIPIGCSEYGCEALNWHTPQPHQGDYTEEYQAYYHEELIKQLFSRKYLWATHVWNMFDFGADARNEGGENGQNHKGLVTFDRKYKKDAFYAYKAWLSDDPFVHICGKRYVDRVEDVTKVTVYSNLPEVELLANGKSLGKQKNPKHFFYFEVPNTGETKLTAVAGDQRDESLIRKVKKFNEAYRLKEKGAVLNWFDIEAPEGRFSLNDKVSEIMGTTEGQRLFQEIASQLPGPMGSGKMGPDLTRMMGGFTLLRLINLMGVAGTKLTKEQLLDLNAQLNKIEKPESSKV